VGKVNCVQQSIDWCLPPLDRITIIIVSVLFNCAINKNVDISLIFFTADKPRNFNLISSREVTNEGTIFSQVLNITGGEQMFW
jgi:hypothetical protein